MRTDGQGRYAFRRLVAGNYGVALRNPPGIAVPRLGVRPVTLGNRGGGRADFAVLPSSLLRIADVQGRSHVSPFARREVVSLPGVVTALRSPAGFYVQSPLPDASADTSEGLFVSAARMPDVAPGDLMLLDGRIEERTAAGAETRDLSVTTLVLTGHRRLGRRFDVPEPVVLGEGGRVPPDRIISNDAGDDVDKSLFDPGQDGLDFYESLEGMLVQVNEPLVVGSIDTGRGEVEVVGDRGRHATTLTARGGLALLAGDQNPERITIDLKGEPDVAAHQVTSLAVGDRLPGPVVGLVDYSGSAYKVLPSRPLPQAERAALPRQVATLRADERTLTCATLNLLRQTAGSSRERTVDLAETIVRALHSPQIVAVVGMQDESGPDGAATARALLEAIRAAGGPATYRWRDIAPGRNGDGEGPAGGIRAGFVYDRERVQLVERMGGNSRTAVLVREASGRPELSFSPGLIGTDDPAFREAARPVAAEFLFRGQRLFVIAAHLAASDGDPADFGRIQPPRPEGAARRLEQARRLSEFAAAILSRDRGADVIVFGGFNEPTYGPAMQALKAGLLFDLAEQRLPPEERYTSVRRGNSIDLDHVLVSRRLLESADARAEIVHRYAEYTMEGRNGDHDPVLASFRFR